MEFPYFLPALRSGLSISGNGALAASRKNECLEPYVVTHDMMTLRKQLFVVSSDAKQLQKNYEASAAHGLR